MAVDSKADLFESDHEELFNQLLSGESLNREDFMEIAEQFRSDVPLVNDTDFWTKLLDWADGVGLSSHVASKLDSAVSLLPSRQSNSLPQMPASLTSPEGKMYLSAAAGLLRVSEERAVKLTLSSLKHLQKTSTVGVEPLVGWGRLILTVMQHAADQRSARLAFVTECLRLEQDHESRNHSTAKAMLDEMDKWWQLGGKERGLFHRLLALLCADNRQLTKKELDPLLDLTAHPQTPGNTAHEFVSDCLHFFDEQRQNERHLAIEAITVLLYGRTRDFSRYDYAILLRAVTASGLFFASQVHHVELSRRASLVCVQCVSLWAAAGNPSWIQSHPLLTGVVNRDVVTPLDVVKEFHCLRDILVDLSVQVINRRSSALTKDMVVEVPESLALLSFGLLVQLAHQTMPIESQRQTFWRELSMFSSNCLQWANDAGAFAYLKVVLLSLLPEPQKLRWQSFSLPFDCRLTSEVAELFAPDHHRHPSASQVVHGTIALEILAATLTALDGALDRLENIEMLCDLVSVIFVTCPVFSQQFWTDFGRYSTNQLSMEVTNFSLCRLLDVAFQLALSTIRDDFPGGSDEDLVEKIGPLFKLVSSMSASQEIMRDIFQLVPPRLFSLALSLCLAGISSKFPPSMAMRVSDLLSSMARIAETGPQERAQLLAALDGKTDWVGRVSCFVTPKETLISAKVMHLMAVLLSPGSPDPLPVASVEKFAKFFSDHALTPSEQLSMAACESLITLIANTPRIVFDPSMSQLRISKYVGGVLEGIKRALRYLPSTVSEQKPSAQLGITLRTTLLTVKAAREFLAVTRQVRLLHSSASLRAFANEWRDAFLHAIVSSEGISQALCYHATAPVSLALSAALRRKLKQQNVEWMAQTNNNQSFRTGDGQLNLEHEREKMLYAKALIADFHHFKVDLASEFEADGSLFIALSLECLGLLSSWAFDANETIHDLGRTDPSKASPPFEFGVVDLMLTPVSVPHSMLSQRKLWPSGLTTLDMLLPFLSYKNHSVIGSAALKLLRTLVVQMRLVDGGFGPFSDLSRPLGHLYDILLENFDVGTSMVVASDSSFSTQDAKLAPICLQSLDLLSALAESNPLATVSAIEGSKFVRNLADCIKSVESSISGAAAAYTQELVSNDKLQLQLKATKSCIGIASECIASLMGKGGLTGAEFQLELTGSSVVSDLCKVVKSLVPTLARDESALATGFIAKAVELVAREAIGVSKQIRVSSSGFRDVIDQVSAWKVRCVQVDTISFVAQAHDAFRAMASLPPTCLAASQPMQLPIAFAGQCLSFSSLEDERTTDWNVRDAASFFSRVCGEQNEREVASTVEILNSSHRQLATQLALLRSWNHLLQLQCLDQDEDRGRADFDISVSIDVLGQIEEIIVAVETVFQGQEGIFVLERSMPSHISLVLTAAKLCTHQAGDSRTTTFVAAACKTAVKLGSAMTSSKSLCLSQQLLLSAAKSIMSRDGVLRAMLSSKNTEVVDVVSNVATILQQRGTRQATGDPNVFGLVRACTSLITLVLLRSTSEPGKNRLLKQFAVILESHDFVKNLTQLTQQSVENGRTKQQRTQYLALLVQLFTAVADAAHEVPAMMTFLERPEMSMILLENRFLDESVGRWSGSGQDPLYRGYLPIASKRKSARDGVDSSGVWLSGEVDQLHSLWLLVIRLVAALARVSTTHNTTDTEAFGLQLARRFVMKFRQCMQSCFEHCNDVFTGEEAGSSLVLTINVLREANETLLLLCQLVSFSQSESSADVLVSIRSVLSGLCQFLGAAGTARHLFSLIGTADDNGSTNRSDMGHSTQSLHPLLAGGVANARYEAIRNAHFARRCYAPVTNQEYEGSSHGINAAASGGNPLSSVLESRCQLSLNSQLNLQMESLAAQVVSSGLILLWKLHPSAFAFSTFPADSVSFERLPPFSAGDVVAFVKDDKSSKVEFGLVEKVETFKRNVQVRCVEESTSTTIPFAKVVGIEDRLRRKSLLRYAPASTSSHTYTSSVGSLSVGHLIQLLRWSSSRAKDDSGIGGEIAEQASALLATELALHCRETLGKDKEMDRKMNQQIYEVFGPAFNGNNVEVPQRLQPLVDPQFWQLIQKQLGPHLEAAVEERRQRGAKQMHLGRGGF